MKTLILNGSPHKAGDTAALLAALKPEGEVKRIDAFEAQIASCRDCRYCRTHSDCSIKDGMEALYRQIEESDCIIIASPVWQATLPAPLLAIGSRLQRWFSASFFRKEQLFSAPKKGAVILTGGGSGGARSAYETACILLRQMGVKGEIPLVSSLETDRLPAKEDTAALEAVKNILKKEP